MRIILSYIINFNKEALKDTEQAYEKVKFTPEQSKLIQELSNFLYEIIKIPGLALKGTTWKALREWLIKNKKNIAEIGDMPIEEKLNAIKEIFCIGNRILKGMLKHPKDKNGIIIDIAFEKAFKNFLNYTIKNKDDERVILF
ncbi:hypothetical protein LCGC14_1044410 [marine sediment metagenome]|uniref:Uncharacterized protein n=1 Tax=marine sediment metagenome TaxID=412755 RepID=A0A0F9MQQ3_9ZZZZ